MTDNQGPLMTKRELAKCLGVSVEDLERWAQSWAFAPWLSVCAAREDRTHDEYDILIFTLVNEFNSQIEDNVPRNERICRIKQELKRPPEAASIRHKRTMEWKSPQVARWQVVKDACLKYRYEWLKPLRSYVDSIVVFGCWATKIKIGCSATKFETCAEPYALLWTLKATRIVVIDKNAEHILNAQKWLENTREKHEYFKNYNMEFVVGDMTDDALNENGFDLSYCKDVLYNMYPDWQELQDSINTMARVVKPGGWVIAVEQKMGVEHESVPSETLGWEVPKRRPGSRPVDISHLFEGAGLVKVNLDNAPDCSYCYNKPNR